MRCPICGSSNYREKSTVGKNNKGETVVTTKGRCRACGNINASAAKLPGLTLAEAEKMLAEWSNNFQAGDRRK